MFKIIKELPFDKKITVYEKEGIEVYLLRPSVLSKRFKAYDVNKNFQIWLKYDNREFRPNHLRVMIDLNLRSRSRPDLKKELLLAFDNIFYGNDPEEELQPLQKERFEHFLNPIIVIGILSQLFILEQAYAYNKESKFEPLTLFYQGWVRESIDNIKEIDNLCMSISNGQPPKIKYTKFENKKNKKYFKTLKPLWYWTN